MSFRLTSIAVVRRMSTCPKNYLGQRMVKSSSLPCFLEDHLRTKSIVQHIRAKVPALSGPATNSQKVKIPKLRLLQVVVMGCTIVHVGSQPYNVSDLLVFDVAEDIGDFELPASAGHRRSPHFQRGRPWASVPSPTCKPMEACQRQSLSTPLWRRAVAFSARRFVLHPGRRCPPLASLVGYSYCQPGSCACQ